MLHNSREVLVTDRSQVSSGPARSAAFEEMLAPCTDNYDIGIPSRYEWPNNVLSTRTVVYEGGWIARAGDEFVLPRWRPDEFELCERLANEAASIMEGVLVEGTSEADTTFAPFYRVAAVDSAGTPDQVDERFVRELFGGTIFPLDPVVVEPLREDGTFWERVVDSTGDYPDELQRWRALVKFLGDGSDLCQPAFVSIGFNNYAPALPIPDAQMPPGFELRGACLPRLAFAFTPAGSVVGIFGHVVWT
ncbi:MAG: hypothetical protein ACRCYQ_12940 [Nocardioides sp.]